MFVRIFRVCPKEGRMSLKNSEENDIKERRLLSLVFDVFKLRTLECRVKGQEQW